MRIWPGKPYPLGATWDGAGVNFALFSESATKVQLQLQQAYQSSIMSLSLLWKIIVQLKSMGIQRQHRT